jgi:hypothetical protein
VGKEYIKFLHNKSVIQTNLNKDYADAYVQYKYFETYNSNFPLKTVALRNKLREWYKPYASDAFYDTSIPGHPQIIHYRGGIDFKIDFSRLPVGWMPENYGDMFPAIVPTAESMQRVHDMFVPILQSLG